MSYSLRRAVLTLVAMTLAARPAGAAPPAEVAAPYASEIALTWTHLYAGRSAVKVADAVRARTEFAGAQTAAARIPHADPRYAWYLEQSQEALLALGLAGPQPALAPTIAPWTGPELPGSIASTY